MLDLPRDFVHACALRGMFPLDAFPFLKIGLLKLTHSSDVPFCRLDSKALHAAAFLLHEIQRRPEPQLNMLLGSPNFLLRKNGVLAVYILPFVCFV